MFNERDISDSLRRLFTQFPILSLTGPRQSGKTTLCKKIFPESAYVSLEDITERSFAAEDHRGFFDQYKAETTIERS